MRRESVVRSALLSGDARDHAQQASRREFRPGQIISYNGQKWTVLDTAGHTVDTPIRARLQRVTHAGVDLKTALITEIDELPDTRTELHLPQKRADLHAGKFVFVEAIQDVIEAGVVTARLQQSPMMLSQSMCTSRHQSSTPTNLPGNSPMAK
jgi:hypothetical protein